MILTNDKQIKKESPELFKYILTFSIVHQCVFVHACMRVCMCTCVSAYVWYMCSCVREYSYISV